MSYLNATAGTSSGMLNSRVPAKMLGVPIIIHDYITGGFTSNNEGVRPNLRTDHMASNPWTYGPGNRDTLMGSYEDTGTGRRLKYRSR